MTNVLLLLFYVLATSMVISGWVPTCECVLMALYSAAPLGDQATSSITWYLTQSHYPDTEPTSPCLILIMPSARLGSDQYKFVTHWFDSLRHKRLVVSLGSSDGPCMRLVPVTSLWSIPPPCHVFLSAVQLSWPQASLTWPPGRAHSPVPSTGSHMQGPVEGWRYGIDPLQPFSTRCVYVGDLETRTSPLRLTLHVDFPREALAILPALPRRGSAPSRPSLFYLRFQAITWLVGKRHI